MSMDRILMKKQHFGIILGLTLFFCLTISSSLQKSVTYDEPVHIGAGLSYWKTADFKMNPEHPPLAKLLAGFPLWISGAEIDVEDDTWKNNQQWEFGKKVLFSWNEYRKTLFLARLPIIFLGVLLCFVVYLFAKEIYGQKAAWIALTLAVFSPELIAHSQLVTTDLALTLFMLCTFYFFWKYMKDEKKKHFYYIAIFLGLSLATKFSAIFMIPLMIVCYVFRCWLHQKSFFQSMQHNNFRERGIFILIILLIISASYFFQGVPHYIEGLQQVFIQSQSSERAVSQYLLGEFSKEGWWYYFPLAFLFKTSIIVLFLFFISLLLTLKRNNLKNEIFLFVPIFGWMILFMFTNLNIGVRHILPVYPFIFIFSSSIATLDFSFLNSFFENQKNKIIITLLFFYILSSLFVYPNYLTFFNELIGPSNGHEYLLDSNIDWGQDLYGLNTWIENNNVEKIKLFYFGNDDPDYYGIKYENIPCFAEVGIVAISVNARIGLIEGTQRCFNWLDMYQPLTTIGNSIWVYNITEEKLRPGNEGKCEVQCRKECKEKNKIYLGHDLAQEKCSCYCKLAL